MNLKWLRTIGFTFFAKRRIQSFQKPLKVNSISRFNGNTYLGKNTNFNGLKVIGRGKLTIGDNFHSGSDCLIITEVHNYKGSAIPYDETYIIKDVDIGDNVWIGSRVIILGGVTIGEGAIIQAGAVVVKDIPPLSITGGNPATVFSKRDEEHYYHHKNLGSFR